MMNIRGKTLRICIAIALFGMSFSTLCAHAVGLKESSILTDDTIKLGDIFYGLKRDEERVLGSSPRPGKEMVLNAKTLLRIALALDLEWRPSHASDHIVLRREATVIEHDTIAEAILTAIREDGVYGDYQLRIPNQYHEIVLPADQPATFDITRLNVDTTRKTFEATIAAPSEINPIQHLRITGHMDAVVDVPVLTGNLQNGRIISKNDITMIKIRERDFSANTIADPHQLIGMTARRLITAGRPIKDADLIAPQIVKRGELVTLSLSNGPLNLTTQVKALQNGAKGDVIRVVNTSSNQVLQAIIQRENEVAVVEN